MMNAVSENDQIKLPQMGRIVGEEHVFPIRIYFEDTDAAGIVYHARYLHYAERARTEMLRLLEASHAEMMSSTGTVFVVRTAEIDYRYPARLDDAVEVRTTAREMQRASMVVQQRVTLAERLPSTGSGTSTGPGASDFLAGGAVTPAIGTELCRVTIRLACVSNTGRPVRIPQRVRAARDSVTEQRQ